MLAAQTECCPLGQVENRIDIVLEGSDFVLFLEVKIDAPEGHLQLERYARAAKAKATATGKKYAALLYLTPGSQPADLGTDLAVQFLHMRWSVVAHALRTAARELDDSWFAVGAARQFADYVEQF